MVAQQAGLRWPAIVQMASTPNSLSSALRANDGVGYLIIIAVQYGVQPLLAKSCIEPGTPTSSLVLVAELIKVLACLAILYSESLLRQLFSNWKLRDSLLAAGLPSVTYLVQNYCIQVSYQNLDGIVFNVLNQSKAIFTAVFSFLIVGRRQSLMQCVALFLVTLAGIIVSTPIEAKAVQVEDTVAEVETRIVGLGCAVAAAALSGLGSGMTEWALLRQKRNNFLLSLELSVLGCLIIAVTLLLGLSPDSETWQREGLFQRWTLLTFVPVLTQGLGGIVVGIITQVAGGVRKVLATICGLILTCTLQQILMGQKLQSSVFLAVPLVAAGIYLHATYPPARIKEVTPESKNSKAS